VKYLLYWLLEKGFTEEEIKQYAESKNYTLEELLKDSNVQIDTLIKKQLLMDFYKKWNLKLT